MIAAAGLLGCTPHPKAPARRVGDAMIEIGMRFQRVGEAATAKRWELATYDIAELGEVLEDDVARSKWINNSDLLRLQHQALPALKAAVTAHDVATVQAAFAAAAESCNGCHKTANVAFIEVQGTPGAAVPSI